MRNTMGKFTTIAILTAALIGQIAFAKTHVLSGDADAKLAQAIEAQLTNSGVLEKGLTSVVAKSENGNILLTGWLQHTDDVQKVVAEAKAVAGWVP